MSDLGLFVTGTDTGCGKTRVSLALMRLYRSRGLQVVGMKPVAAGASPTADGLRNGDALRLQEGADLPMPYRWINPYVFEPAIAPHLAAAEAGMTIAALPIRSAFEQLASRADRIIVEGAGGWRVPLGPTLEMADLPGLLDLPVVLVVGLRLGCINHALLTADSILARGVPLGGWVANLIEPGMARIEGNIATLTERIPAPCLGRLPHDPDGLDLAAQDRGLAGALDLLNR